MSIIGLIKADTRSLDYSSCGVGLQDPGFEEWAQKCRFGGLG